MSGADKAVITHIDWDGGADCELYVHMNNGQSVNLHLNLKRDDPRFADLLAGRCRAAPKTDGQSVYWTDGPRLTFDEIMEMVVT